MFRRGFTLIEILTVLVITIIIASLFVGAYLSFKRQTDLVTSTQNVLSVLNLAQSKTLASEGSSSYGVHLETTQYTFFKGASYPGSDNQVFVLPSRVTINSIFLTPSGSDVVFARLTGRPLQTGTLNLLESVSNATRIINIESSGQMGIATSATLPPNNTRALDSRHVHFTYNTDVRNASTLRLDFSGTISDINFQTYLNAAKDNFDWSGTITVGGQDQVLRIHSHSLNFSAVQFSVTRDKRYNTKALSVSLDGVNLINYDVNGNTTKGASVLVTEPVWQ